MLPNRFPFFSFSVNPLNGYSAKIITRFLYYFILFFGFLGCTEELKQLDDKILELTEKKPQLNLFDYFEKASVSTSKSLIYPLFKRGSLNMFGKWKVEGGEIWEDKESNFRVVFKETKGTGTLTLRFDPLPIFIFNTLEINGILERGNLEKIRTSIVLKKKEGFEYSIPLYKIDHIKEKQKVDISIDFSSLPESIMLWGDATNTYVVGLRILFFKKKEEDINVTFHSMNLSSLTARTTYLTNPLFPFSSPFLEHYNLKRGIITVSPAKVEYDVRLPRNSVISLEWGETVLEDEKVTFSVDIKEKGKDTPYPVPLSQYKGKGETNRLDLSSYAGRSIKIIFSTQSDKPTISAWINPKIYATTQKISNTPNVILYLVDTLRADHLSLYGYHRLTSPHLDRLSRNGVVFENAYAPAPWTLPSIISIFTTLSPVIHGYNDYESLGFSLPDTYLNIFNRMRETGYEVKGFVSNGICLKLTRAFDTIYQLREREIRPLETFGRYEESTSFILNKQVFQWLDERDFYKSKRPFFLYLHTLDPHQPRLPPYMYFKRFSSQISNMDEVADDVEKIITLRYCSKRYPCSKEYTYETLLSKEFDPNKLRQVLNIEESLYDGEVAANDEQFGLLIQELERRSLLENTLIIFVSDHGEEFLEHKGYQHGHSLYNEQVHVPLVVWFPHQYKNKKSIRIANPVSITSIMPTIAELLGLPHKFQEQSLISSIRSTKSYLFPIFGYRDSSTFFYTQRTNITLDSKSYYFVHGNWKAIYKPNFDKLELYNLSLDPHELIDISKENYGKSKEYKKKILENIGNLEKLKNKFSRVSEYKKENKETSPAMEKELKALGYIQ